MGEEDEEPKYKIFVKGQEAPLEKGSQQYTGQGRAFYENGDGYDGTYVEGLRRGSGVYTWKKFGDTYDGQYEENKKHGFGKLVYRNNLGDGDEEEEAADGEGKPPRGGHYEGYFSGGLRGCGEKPTPDDPSDGTFTYSNGDTYVGQWRAGKKHGRGTYSYSKDGTKLIGDWERGKMASGRWELPNGTFYVGRFRYNKPEGSGVWVFPNGNQVTGDYVQKEQPGDGDEPPAEEEEEGAPPKPDPKVWCHFRYGDAVAVGGGAMGSGRPGCH